ncbi:MAG: single-stranded-DNA-specific exonuclease RecJ [Alphaproteobacteria bacterium]|nr:single-stranded-DNA-specific exonuclease RecJ [Alphaproteobacteria bacterium]
MEEKLSALNKNWKLLHESVITNSKTLLQTLLTNRSIPQKQANSFITPLMRDVMPDPSTIPNMQGAVKRAILAFKNKESLAIFGDYDVDGATSSSLLFHYLYALGITAPITIPDRINEGYGPKNTHIDNFAKASVSLLFMVDCGTASNSVIAYAQTKGIDIIILDHHTPSEHDIIPPLCVNPLLDKKCNLHFLCAAGVTFMFLVALQRELRSLSLGNLPDLRSFLDLVAIGTICDIVPLTHLNRAFVKHGLTLLHQSRFPGVKALAIQTSTVSEDDVGFRMGPALNAGSRMGKSNCAATLLSLTSEETANTLATTLIECNNERKNALANAMDIALYEAQKQKDHKGVVLHNDEWSPGIIGLIAARIADQLHKPTWVIAVQGDTAKGAARSPAPSLHLAHHIQKAVQQNLILNGGGHKAAAGFTIETTNIASFKDWVEQTLPKETYHPTLILDAPLPHIDLPSVWDTLAKLRPFGHCNSEPIFFAYLTNITVLKEGPRHISFTGKHEQSSINCIAFGDENSALRATINQSSSLFVACSLNYFNKKFSLRINDVKKC